MDANHNGQNDLIFGASFYRRGYVAFVEHAGWNQYALTDSIVPIDRDFSWDIGYLDNDSLVDVITQHYDPDSITRNIAVFEAPDRDSYPTRRVWRWRYELNGGGCFPMTITDLDRDGKKEILTYDCYILYVFENTTDNNYQMVFCETLNHSCDVPGAVGDFDQDGKTDFLVTLLNLRAISIYECVGDNQYLEVFRDTLPAGLGNGTDRCAGRDLDGDGKPEIIVSSFSGTWQYYLFIYESVGDNQYQVVYTDSFYTGIGVMMADEVSNCGDIDCDGQEELIWAVKGNWLVYKATGNNTYERIFRAYPTWNRHYTTQTSSYDLNQNGYPEIVESGDSADASRTVTRTVLWEIEGVRLHRPNGGEVLTPGSQFPITWEKFTPPGADSFTLFISFNNGVNYQTITTIQQSNDTSFVWSVPDSLSDSCKLMIWAYGPPRPGQDVPRGTAWDFSDSSFAIRQTEVAEGIGNRAQGTGLRILQSPTTKALGVRLLATSHTPQARLQVYDVAGKLVTSFVLSSMPDAPCPIALRLSSGVYFVRLEDDGTVITKKVVVVE